MAELLKRAGLHRQHPVEVAAVGTVLFGCAALEVFGLRLQVVDLVLQLDYLLQFLGLFGLHGVAVPEDLPILGLVLLLLHHLLPPADGLRHFQQLELLLLLPRAAHQRLQDLRELADRLACGHLVPRHLALSNPQFFLELLYLVTEFLDALLLRPQPVVELLFFVVPLLLHLHALMRHCPPGWLLPAGLAPGDLDVVELRDVAAVDVLLEGDREVARLEEGAVAAEPLLQLQAQVLLGEGLQRVALRIRLLLPTRALQPDQVEVVLDAHEPVLLDVREPQHQAPKLLRDIGNVDSVGGIWRDEGGLGEVGPDEQVTLGEQPPELLDADREVVQLLVHLVHPQVLIDSGCVNVQTHSRTFLAILLDLHKTIPDAQV